MPKFTKKTARSNRKESFRHSFKTRAFKAGGYSILATLIVIAIAVGIVLAVDALPSKYTKFDLTDQELFTISEQTENLVSSLDQEVDIYLLAVSGQEDSTLQELLNRYEDLSSYVKVSVVDPVDNPTFVTQYTSDLQYNNSLLVVCGDKNRFIDYYDIFVYDYTNYYYTGEVTETFDGESVVTSAIDYVTSEDLPVMYMLSGHDEASLDSGFESALETANVETESLSLLTEGSVPEDCDCLFINNPTEDISEEEEAIILEYLEAGGKMLLVTDYERDDTPNLDDLMDYYGCHAVDGVVIEQDASYYKYGYYNLLLPDLNYHTITSPLSSADRYVLVPNAQGIEINSDVRDSVTITELLETSDQAYATTDMTTATYEDGDEEGPFAVAVAIEDGDTQIVWISSGSFLNDTIDSYVSGANSDLFVNSAAWMCDREDTISIRAKSMTESTLSLSSQQAMILGALAVIFIPLVLIACGTVVLIRRRRK